MFRGLRGRTSTTTRLFRSAESKGLILEEFIMEKYRAEDFVARRTKVDFRGAFLALQIDFRLAFYTILKL